MTAQRLINPRQRQLFAFRNQEGPFGLFGSCLHINAVERDCLAERLIQFAIYLICLYVRESSVLCLVCLSRVDTADLLLLSTFAIDLVMRRYSPRRSRATFSAKSGLVALPILSLVALFSYTWAAHRVIQRYSASQTKPLKSIGCVAWRRTHSCSPFGYEARA